MLNEMFPEEKGNIFEIVDEGFDVWMSNFRGTRYSLEHETLDNTTLEYWNFSFTELGLYDVPAVIEHVYLENGGEKMYLMN